MRLGGRNHLRDEPSQFVQVFVRMRRAASDEIVVVQLLEGIKRRDHGDFPEVANWQVYTIRSGLFGCPGFDIGLMVGCTGDAGALRQRPLVSLTHVWGELTRNVAAIAVVLSLSLVVPAQAQSTKSIWEEAFAAMKRDDYPTAVQLFLTLAEMAMRLLNSSLAFYIDGPMAFRRTTSKRLSGFNSRRTRDTSGPRATSHLCIATAKECRRTTSKLICGGT